MRVRMIVAYDGTAYHGWQIQNNANTIEAELNKHLSELLKEDIQVIGASRTDAGVHSLGNIAVFDTNTRMPADKISFALNRVLPDDIRIMDSRQVPDSYHPRHQKTKKTYEYRICRGTFPIPTERLYSHFMYRPLDVDLMREASRYLIGEHDFKSFCSVGTQAETTVRTIYDITILEDGPLLKIRVTGNGFLYNMVRIIAGTLVEVGIGHYEPIHVREILDALDRTAAGPTMPAVGLTLYAYEEEEACYD